MIRQLQENYYLSEIKNGSFYTASSYEKFFNKQQVNMGKLTMFCVLRFTQ